MLQDAHLPPGFFVSLEERERGGVSWQGARWADAPAGTLGRLARALRQGAGALAAIPDDDLLRAWGATVEAFLDPASPERRALAPALARLARLSPAGLDAGLAAVLGGVREAAAARLFARARGELPADPAAGPTPAWVILAGNLPALAVQPLLPALALRRPLLLKSASAEPLFAPAFLSALAAREPRLAGAVAAAAWPGGDADLEGPLLAEMGRIVAYGDQEALDDLSRRAPGRVTGYGPKASLAVVGRDAVTPPGISVLARGLARDVALFDQRGCLSLHAVYTDGDARALGEALAAALREIAAELPPGPPDLAESAAAAPVRLAAEMAGQAIAGLAPAAGTVILETTPAFRPSPGLRTVRVHPLESLAELPAILAPWQDRLQGAALAGEEAWRLTPELAALGFSRFAAPGELQSPDATWWNGGIDPLRALGGA